MAFDVTYRELNPPQRTQAFLERHQAPAPTAQRYRPEQKTLPTRTLLAKLGYHLLARLRRNTSLPLVDRPVTDRLNLRH